LRFVVTAEWRRNRLLQTIVILFVLFIVLLWISNALLYFSKMGLGYESVVEYYRGSEAKLLAPKSYLSLLEISHGHLFAMAILLLTLTHLMLFVPLDPRLKVWLVVVPFLSALADEGAGWLVRFVSPNFAYLKIAGFLMLQTSLAVLVGLTLWAVLAGSQTAYSGENSALANGDEESLKADALGRNR
jgi:hypothetical protein